MNSSISSVNVSATAAYVPLARQPVGQETGDLKISSLKAVEQPASGVRSENRRESEDRNVYGRTRYQPVEGVDSKDQQNQRKAAQQEQIIKDRAAISSLAARDREVRAHEQAHASVGGQYAGSPTYEFVKGPDGVNYAVAGEVSISLGSVAGDPEATILKAQQIRAAANAPADPSGQDRSVAAAAAKLEAEARAELNALQAAEIQQKEKAAEQQTKEQKAEESRKAEAEERYREEQKKLTSSEEDRAKRSNAERVDGFVKAHSKTIDIGRHLVDIGAVAGFSAKGGFLNQQA